LLWPDTTDVNSEGHLVIGGCDTVELARQFGTPLYVFDEATVRSRCRQYTRTLASLYPSSQVVFACKAFINPALARLFDEEGLGLDVVSGGEMAVARVVNFPAEKVCFHGNNKSLQELREAVEWGVGRVMIDNFYEIALLENVCREFNRKQAVMLRLSPGVEAHTHEYLKTGILDSKFGFPIVTGQAQEALRLALASPHLEVTGLHAHIGTQILETEPFEETVDILFEFAALVAKELNFTLQEISLGGGLGIHYTSDDDPPPIPDFVRILSKKVREAAGKYHLAPPKLLFEPGRSILGEAGVTLYTIGSRKVVPNVRTYVAVDGGMGDNIRPAMYGAKYTARVANKANDRAVEKVTIAGKFCESGDILIRDIDLPPLEPGDILAIAAAGAYAPAMASNYNLFCRPAMVLVADDKAQLIRRRETYDDLVARDIWETTPEEKR